MIELWFLYTALSLMGLILRIKFYYIPFDSLQVMFQTRKKEIVHKCPQLFLTCLQDAESYVFRQSVIFRKVLVCIVLNSENINKTSKFHWFTVWEHVTKSYDGPRRDSSFWSNKIRFCLSINSFSHLSVLLQGTDYVLHQLMAKHGVIVLILCFYHVILASIVIL